MAAWVKFPDVRARRATVKALLCAVPKLGDIWVPFSQLCPDSEVKKPDDHGVLIVSTWIAGKWKEEFEEGQQYGDPEWYSQAPQARAGRAHG
jgi:hypothetical protein